MEQNLQQPKKWGYTWVIVALCCLMVTIALGFCSSSKSIYISPVCEANGLARSAFSLSDTTRYITTALVNIFFGTLIYKFGAKKLILGGLTSLFCSMLTYSLADNVVGFCLGGALLGLGLSFTTTTMVGAVVNTWCQKSKGTIMGLALACNGIGGAVSIQILTPIIAKGVYGYRNAYRLVAVCLVVVFVLILLFFRNQPEKKPVSPETVQKKPRTDYRSILKTPYLYPAALCIFFTGMVLQSIHGITAPLLEDAGMQKALVANVLSVSSLLLFCSKFGVGFLYDKTGLRITTLICFSSSIVSCALLILVANTASGPLAFAYSFFSALALPLETIMLPIYARELFGDKRFNEALGIFVSFNTAGYALGSPLGNLCYDVFGSYHVALYISAGLMLFTLILLHIVISVARKKQAAEAEA
ncbi:MAG: MFS transporter [Clostridia bacterium]|nr:MFS transporter [Clostridia bacterium]